MVPSGILVAVLSAAVPCGSDTGCVVGVKVGSAELRLRVDTGADITTITKAAASRTDLHITNKDPVIRLSGASQDFFGVLKRTNVKVGNRAEKDVMIVIAPGLQVGDVDGLLGMSYLERFRMSIGEELELTPIDADDKDKRGGRGERWWRLIFRQVQSRRAVYERALVNAQKIDAAIESVYGQSQDGDDLTTYTKRLRDFMRDYEHRLQNHASRFSVPRAWRGKR